MMAAWAQSNQGVVNRETYWITREGDAVRYKDMEDRHIFHATRMCLRGNKFWLLGPLFRDLKRRGWVVPDTVCELNEGDEWLCDQTTKRVAYVFYDGVEQD